MIEKTAIEKDILKGQSQVIHDKNTTDLMRALELLHNPTNLEANTILTNRQVIALSVINWGSQIYDIKFFQHFIKLFPRYRISGDDGRGRKELIQIAEAIRRDKEEEHKRMMELIGRR